MAIPKKGSRKIYVDGENYRWLVRRKTTYTQSDYGVGTINVGIEHYDHPGTSMVVFTDIPHPQDCMNREKTKVVPSDLARWIREGLELGWRPKEKGPQLLVSVDVGILEKYTAH